MSELHLTYYLTRASSIFLELVQINEQIRYHDVEICGEELREAMTAMEAIIK